MMKIDRNSTIRNAADVCFRGLACCISMGVLLGSSALLQAQQPDPQPGIGALSARAVTAAMAVAAPASARPAEQEEQATGPRKPGDEGIKVHGHWVIDVRNPDGSLAHHTEFENSVQPSGEDFILGLIAGAYSSGDLAIALNGSPSPCLNGGCLIVRTIGTNPASNYCAAVYFECPTTLVTTFNSGATPSLVMTGSVTAYQNGSINQVQTFFSVCGYGLTKQSSDTIAASACPVQAAQAGVLTSAGSPAITATPVSTGQLIQVTVTITLS